MWQFIIPIIRFHPLGHFLPPLHPPSEPTSALSYHWCSLRTRLIADSMLERPSGICCFSMRPHLRRLVRKMMSDHVWVSIWLSYSIPTLPRLNVSGDRPLSSGPETYVSIRQVKREIRFDLVYFPNTPSGRTMHRCTLFQRNNFLQAKRKVISEVMSWIPLTLKLPQSYLSYSIESFYNPVLSC